MTDDLKNMSDKELAKRIIGYVDRIESLMNTVSDILERKIAHFDINRIRDDYKSIKEAVKNDAHYVSLSRNENRKNQLYHRFFRPSVAEASAFGFTVPTNSSIDFKLFASLEEARYKLTKYYSYNEWKKIADA